MRDIQDTHANMLNYYYYLKKDYSKYISYL